MSNQQCQNIDENTAWLS